MANIPPNINLMAWRAKQQSRRSRKLWRLIINTVMLAVIAVIVCHCVLSYEIHLYTAERLQLQQKLTQQQQLQHDLLQTQKETNLLASRINFSNDLHYHRQQTIQLLTQLSNMTPAGVYLISMTQKNQQVTLVGKTVSSSQLAVLMQNIEQSNVLSDAHLNEMKFNNTNPPYQNDFVIITNMRDQPSSNQGN